MENLTHSLTGLALSRAGLNRYCPHASFLLIVAANIPDIDMLSLLGGPLYNLSVHRGFTHSVFFLPLMAILPVLIVSLIKRKWLPWRAAYLLSCIGVISHLLLDWSMAYGIRLLAPVSSQWYRLDLNFLTDAVILAVLLLAALGPVLGKLVSGEIGARPTSGRGLAIFALSFLVLYDVGRYFLHQRALAQLDSRLYSDTSPLRVAAFPTAVNPLIWEGLVETQNQYRLYELNAAREFDPTSGDVLYKPQWRPEFEKAKQTPQFRAFLDFAQFPIWFTEPVSDPSMGSSEWTKASVTDLRFGKPGAGAFTISALVDSHRSLQRVWFEFRPQRSVAIRQ